MLCILIRTKQNLLFPLIKLFSPSLIEYAVGSQLCMVQLFHLVSLVEVNSPFVKRGSGSFLKKDFSKLVKSRNRSPNPSFIIVVIFAQNDQLNSKRV